MSDIAEETIAPTTEEKKDEGDIAMEEATNEGLEAKETPTPAGNGSHGFGSHMGEPQRDANGKLIVPEGMTKNQYKKLLKEQQWEAGREARRAERKEKNKEVRQRKRQKRKATEEAGQPEVKKARVYEDITFVLDCAFDDLMIDKEINSLSSQIVRCYSANRMSTHRCKLKLTSYSGRLQKRMDVSLQRQHENWHNFEVTTDPYPINSNTIYLTAESDTTLETLDPGMTYIVGGIVDKNRHKGLCHKKATEQGLRTAKLPIGEYIQMASRHVLTTNHVVEIMLKWLEVRDWKKAFLEIIPQRKLKNELEGTKGSVTGDEEHDEEDAEEEEEGEKDGTAESATKEPEAPETSETKE